jgi:phytoene desaturase
MRFSRQKMLGRKGKHILVIGAGMGGLAAALRLRHHGLQVTLVEKNARPGGRSNLIPVDGFRVDSGPTILVMRSAIEDTYRAIGESLDQRLEWVRIQPNYRIYFADGTSLDLHSDMRQLAEEVEGIAPHAAARVFRFLAESAKKYSLGMDFVERNYSRLTDLVNPQAILRLLQTGAHQNLYAQVDRWLGNEKLNQAFSFHSMFLGLSPFEALAMYSLITYADLVLGMWYPKGGIYRLVEDMVHLAEERGVELRTSAAVEEITLEDDHVTGVRLENGEHLKADLVLSNADLPYTYRQLIRPRHRRNAVERRLKRMKYACSGYLLYLGVDRTYPHMCHQSIVFSSDYRANLDAIFKWGVVPPQPSFHLSIPTVTDASVAPAGQSLLYVLAPMPNLQFPVDWEANSPIVREALFRQLERIVDPQIRQHILWQREYTPVDFERDYNAVYGTAFGSLAHNFLQSAYFRPHNKDKDIQGLYFVGQGTYPGIGMPMVHISAKLVTERILREI